MKYSRPQAHDERGLDKIRRRLAGDVLPNASGARAEAPKILASSEASRELTPSGSLSAEQEAVAAANRKLRQEQRDAALVEAALDDGDPSVEETEEPPPEL